MGKEICRIHFFSYAGEKGFEPLTFGFGDHYSTIETILLFHLRETILILIHRNCTETLFSKISHGLSNRGDSYVFHE